MKVIEVDNVNEALPAGLAYLAAVGEVQPSRAGSVVVAPGPVTTVYRNPSAKVLFSPLRDNNPFFSFMESLWMLAGRDDAKFLDHYVKDFSARFAEADGTMHGAYGYRWRTTFGLDQLDVIVERLKDNPDDRQCVLQMWNCDVVTDSDLTGEWKDRPCNTHIYFRVRSHAGLRYLDMTVCCRSNDILWGAYGANAVHFAVLLEYMSVRIGVRVGTYYQISNNYHMYVSEIERLHMKVCGEIVEFSKMLRRLSLETYWDRSANDDTTVDMFNVYSAKIIDQDITNTLALVEKIHRDESCDLIDMHNWPTHNTAVFMAQAYRQFRAGRIGEAIGIAGHIPFMDWRMACIPWLQRRIK